MNNLNLFFLLEYFEGENLFVDNMDLLINILEKTLTSP